MTDLRLAIFDVDGTLVDSQGDIVTAMRAAFGSEGFTPPSRDAVLSIVGLSLPQAMARLAPELGQGQCTRLVSAYKESYALLVRSGGAHAAPLFDGMAALLDRLTKIDHLLLAVATGKSRRGLTSLLELHGLNDTFVTTQVADDHPSKPNPAMLYAALADAGVEAEAAVMIGDTSFDMEMAQAAGVAGIGVTWGYHPASALRGAAQVVSDALALEQAIFQILGDGT